jgi:hypothetical protein
MPTMTKKHPLWTALLLAAAVVPAQQDPKTPPPASAADLQKQFARAQLLEQHEGDLGAAERAYRAILEAGATGPLAAQTNLALGTLLWRLARVDDAEPFLAQAIAAGGELGQRAQALRDGQDEAAKFLQAQHEKARLLRDRLQDIASQKRNRPEVEHGFFDKTLATVRDDLWSLGEAGATAVIAELDAEYERGNLEGYFRDADKVEFRKVLWGSDTHAARSYLLRVAAEEPIDWQRYVTAEVVSCPPGLAPAVLRLLEVADPAGIVQEQLRELVSRLPVADMRAHLGTKNPAARRMLLQSLADRWKDLAALDQKLILDAAAEWSPAAGAAADDASYPLLRAFGTHGPRAAALLAWRHLANSPAASWAYLYWSSSPGQREFGDAEVELLHLAMQRLPTTDAATRLRAETGLGRMVTNATHDWSSASVDALLDCIELGLCADARAGDHPWLGRLHAAANATQRLRLHSLLHRIGSPGRILQESRNEPATPSLCAPLRATFEAATRGRTLVWQNERPAGWQDGGPEGQNFARVLLDLIQLMVHHADAELPGWLFARCQQEPRWAPLIVQPLVELSQRFDSPALREALRALLVWQPPAGETFRPQLRDCAFLELARLGDPAAIPLFPRAYALGLAPAQFRGRAPVNLTGRGITWLSAENQNGAVQSAHGYEREALRTAWRTLLESPSSTEVWADLEGTTGNLQIPSEVLSVLVPLLPAQFAAWRAANQSNLDISNHLRRISNALSQVSEQAWQADAELQTSVRELLTNADPELATAVCYALPDAVVAACADPCLGLLARSNQPATLAPALLQAAIALPMPLWHQIFEQAEPDKLITVLTLLPKALPAELQRLVEAAATLHFRWDVRVHATKALARTLGTAAVPTLLRQLRDPSEAVKKAAQTALDELRTEQEQQRFWQQANAGVDTTPASTAAKLLLQAAPNQPKDRRLLAITALGTLGEPAALPYLIDYSAEADGQIAMAAKEALTAIHAAAARRLPR